MKDFYLFGAGINCEAVISFFGIKNIKGIIDSNIQLHGKSINGIEIMGVDEYIKNGQNEKIYITSYYQAESIIENLKERKRICFRRSVAWNFNKRQFCFLGHGRNGRVSLHFFIRLFPEPSLPVIIALFANAILIHPAFG